METNVTMEELFRALDEPVNVPDIEYKIFVEFRANLVLKKYLKRLLKY